MSHYGDLVNDNLNIVRFAARETKEVVESLQADGHARALTDWLLPADPSTNFNRALGQRHHGSGQWFLEGKAYSAWKKEDNSFLWLYGIPGCGKTILSSIIIEDLLNKGVDA
jgi:DNA replication protein DnaC